MRRSVLIWMMVLSLFALAAAAATSITVVGVYDPLAGSDPVTTCDPGTVTIAEVNDGTNLTGFTLKTANSTAGCDSGYKFYVKVAATGTSAPANDYYFMSVAANANYSVTAHSFQFAATTTIFDDYDSTASPVSSNAATSPALVNITIGTASVTLSTSAPTGNTTGPAGWGA